MVQPAVRLDPVISKTLDLYFCRGRGIRISFDNFGQALLFASVSRSESPRQPKAQGRYSKYKRWIICRAIILSSFTV